LRSDRLAARATDAGDFAREIVPIAIDGHTVTSDQGIRADTSLEALAQLAPAFKAGGKITAGNSSQVSDGAARSRS
jgi:acetyl-CoA acyltransferase